MILIAEIKSSPSSKWIYEIAPGTSFPFPDLERGFFINLFTISTSQDSIPIFWSILCPINSPYSEQVFFPAAISIVLARKFKVGLKIPFLPFLITSVILRFESV